MLLEQILFGGLYNSKVVYNMAEIPWRNYEEWIGQVPNVITSDPLWELETYRKALFFSDLAWFDSEKLLSEPRGKQLAWQLVDSAGSVPANIEEGYSRGFGKDYARFLRISLAFMSRSPRLVLPRSPRVYFRKT